VLASVFGRPPGERVEGAPAAEGPG
jgi:hypothetical protein